MDEARNILTDSIFALCQRGTMYRCSAFFPPTHFVGYPFFVSIGYFFSFNYILVAMLVSFIMALLSIAAAFILIRQVTRSSSAGILGAFVLAFLPIHIIFSSVPSVEVTGLFLLFFAFIAFFRLIDSRRIQNILFFFSATSLYLLSRPEAIMLVPFFVLGLFLTKRRTWENFIIASAICITSYIALIHIAYVGTCAGATYNIGWSKIYSILKQVLFFIPGLCFFALIGAIALWKKNTKLSLLILSAQLLLILPFFFTQYFFTKYILYFLPHLLILASYGVYQIYKIIALKLSKFIAIFSIFLILLLLFISSNNHILKNPESSMQTDYFLRLMQDLKNTIPHDSLLITAEESGYTLSFANYSYMSCHLLPDKLAIQKQSTVWVKDTYSDIESCDLSNLKTELIYCKDGSSKKFGWCYYLVKEKN